MTPGLYQAELRHCIYTRNGMKIWSSLVVKERGTSPALTAWRSGILFTSLVGANPEPVTPKVCNPSAEAVKWAATVPLAQAQLLTVSPRQGSLEPGACAEVTVTASSDFTVTANFLQQYKLTATANVPGTVPAGIRPTGTATPASADWFYNTGTAVLLTAGNSTAVRFVNWTGDGTGTASTLLVTMRGAKTMTVGVSNRTGGNVLAALTNTSTVVATNLRITAIGPITADTAGTTIVWDQGVVGAPGLVLPWELGNLGAGVSTSRNLGFRATAGAISSGFRFAITIAADNMAAVTTTVVVPASGVAVLDVVSPVRTNSPGVIGVGFSVPNSGDVAAGNVQAAISVTVPNGSLQIGNPLVTLGSIDAGKTATLAVSLTGAPGANLAGVTFNTQVTLVYSQPSGATATVRHTWSMGTTVTQLN